VAQNASVAPDQHDDATRGYDRVVVHGKELLCRTEPILGTRIKSRVCLTRAQLQAQQEAARKYIETLQRNQGAVVGGVPIVGGPMGAGR
jgi:hypothetical protein